MKHVDFFPGDFHITPEIMSFDPVPLCSSSSSARERPDFGKLLCVPSMLHAPLACLMGWESVAQRVEQKLK
jgi:hypothetical protein